MIRGVTRHLLPHLSGIPHLHACKQALKLVLMPESLICQQNLSRARSVFNENKEARCLEKDVKIVKY